MFKRIDSSALAGKALHWAVAKALNYDPQWDEVGQRFVLNSQCGFSDLSHFKPSIDVNQAIDLIHQEGIATRPHSSGVWYAMTQDDLGDNQCADWAPTTYRGAEKFGPLPFQFRARVQRLEGPTMPIAALRCIVAKRLGNSVEVPALLVESGVVRRFQAPQ